MRKREGEIFRHAEKAAAQHDEPPLTICQNVFFLQYAFIDPRQNTSGATLRATLSFERKRIIICRQALSFEGVARIIIQIRKDLFLDGYAV